MCFRSSPLPAKLGKKEEMTKGRKADWAGKRNRAPTLAQSLDPPLQVD